MGIGWINGMPAEIKLKISATLKAKGIKPPSNKGKHFTKEHVYKIIEAKRKNGSLYHTAERTEKIQQSRKRFYDKVGRKSKLVDRIKNTKKYRAWRKVIFERDNYTCVLCNKRGGKLHCDHIIQKAIYLKACQYDYNRCMNYASLWDIKNGRTLCYKCHKATSTYGKLL
ncbi:MAG: HNH endonuclease [Prolixibacteraceae bacterium]|nr:HNH endonuclease [Prolixibacteraceae bacterium]